MPIYTDSGCIKSNPSPYGITFCWILVENDELLDGDSGYETCYQTNNQGEFYAILKALESMPDGWSGEVYSDSQTALKWWGRRSSQSITKFMTIKQFEGRVDLVLHRLGKVTFKHIKGHMGVKDRTEQHCWQQLCDDECNNQAGVFARQYKGKIYK